MKIKDYEFDARNWPAPKDLQHKDVYLFGFDEYYVPWIVRWESGNKANVWCACTLEDSLTSSSSSELKYIEGEEVNRTIKWWAQAPALRSALSKLEAQTGGA